MAENVGESGTEKNASDSSLRHVEKDVLISKMIRMKSHEICFEPYVRDFEDCVRGRTVSVVWKCRKENKAMQECLRKHYTSPEVFEQCKAEYLQQRAEFRRTGVTQKQKNRTHYYGI